MNLFANLYPVQKTLRFELRPVGETLDRIVKSGLLEEDEQRAEDYKKAKKIIDEYHKEFISKALKEFKLNYADNGGKDSLEEYFFYYNLKQRGKTERESFEAIQKNLRKQIAARFKQFEEFKRIFKKELIEDDLPSFVKSSEERLLVEKFKGFTTYFTGFHENRENMYSDEEHSTAISYRLIHENLPKFIDNLLIFKKLETSRVSDHFKQLYTAFLSYLNVHSIEEMFTLAYFNEVMTQEQIDVCNAIIGGRSEEQGKPKIQGLNEYINLYNQQQTEKKDRLPKLKPLFKQILSDKNAISWLPEEFGSDQELLESVGTWYDDLYAKVFVDRSPTEPCLEHLLYGISEFELSLIYLRNDTSITQISQGMFGDWSIINRAIEADFKRKFPLKKNETSEKYDKRRDDYLKSFDSFSIAYLNDCLKAYGEPYAKRVDTYFATLGASQADLSKPHVDCFAQVREAYAQAKDLLTTPYPITKKLVQDKQQVEKIKVLLDAVKLVQWFAKPLLGSGTESNKEERFYAEFSYLWEEMNQVTSLYNKVRNYMTKKPYSMEKFKLNFENSLLLKGWDVNKEKDNTSVILRKEGIYYLGIMQ
ncbi:MAG: type V CRISPR-associated protein Cas12a/Cpf1, partial [Bacteroidales bacterium]